MTNEEMTLLDKSNEYAWKLVKNEELNKEKLEEYKKEILSDKEKLAELFTNFSENDALINEAHLITGYSTFGREFIEKAINEDKDSAINMLENITQMYIELNEFVSSFAAKMENLEEQSKGDE